jgi:hypothetical protein
VSSAKFVTQPNAIKTFVLGCLMLAFCLSARAQVDYKISADCKVKVGYNATPEGRLKNRRVEFKILE